MDDKQVISAGCDVLITNELDGETYHYDNVADVLLDFKLDQVVLDGLIKGFPNKVIYRGNGLFSFQAIYRDRRDIESTNWVMVKNYLTDTIFVATSPRLAAQQTGLDRLIISEKTNTGLMVNGFMFKTLDDFTPFPDVSYDDVKASRLAYAKFCKDNTL